jgi:hypothetical protein
MRIMAIAALIFLDHPTLSFAGMPSVTLSDLARMRVQTISFFLLVFIVCSWVVQRIWNGLRKDFTWLPFLSFRRAMGLVALWGLLFVLVLTMISGARELMTPGAWKKEGFTYKLKDGAAASSKPAEIDREPERRAALDRLKAALWTYARHHDGRFPSADSAPEIPEAAWRIPDPSGMSYIYTPGLTAEKDLAPLAYEPAIFGGERLVLLSDGQIVLMNDRELSFATRKAP